jgi:hypothetical protein
MRLPRWVVSLAPALLLGAAITTTGLLMPSLPAAGSASSRGCPPPDAFVEAVAGRQRDGSVDAQLDLATMLSTAGEVSGRRLSLATAVGPRGLTLAPEAFAAPPVANVVLFGQYEPAAGSTLSAIDLLSGCLFSLWSTGEVVRSAILDPGLTVVYAHTVAAADRADGGVQRIELNGGDSARVVPPPTAAEPFGPTFATLLRWSVDADALAVQSCGLAACRTRLLDIASGDIETYDDAGQGQLVGVAAAKLVTFAACAGRPCPLVVIERPSGRRASIDIAALAASLREDGQGPLLDIDTPAGSEEVRP